MNFLKLRQFLVPTLIVMFLLSCVGTSLGMMLHNTIITENETGQVHLSEKTEAAHGCCTVSQSEQSPMTMKHMSSDAAAVVSTVFFMIAVFFYVVRVQHEYLQSVRVRYYLKRWRERWQYFSLYILRLFSQGILHPKTW